MTSHQHPAPPVSGAAAVLRPSRSAYGRALRANLWIAIPLLLVSLIRVSLNWWLLPVFAGALLVTVGCVLLYFRNARVEYADGSYTVVSMFGSRRTFVARDATAIVTVTALLSGVAGGVPQLIVLGPDRRKLLRLRGQTWDLAQFTELATDLIGHGVPHEAIPEPITRAALRERYPQAVSWAEAHPIACGLLISVGFVVILAIAFVFIVFASPA